ncbi:MAG: carotenoid oxygenase family protein, partial [Limnothrix sp.]
MFLRNGPNPQFAPIGRYHWFDGDGMIHGVHLQNGKASYRNRYVQTKGYLKENAAQEAIWSGMMEPPQMELPEGPFKNPANTALVWHAGKFLATWEGGEPHALGLPELNTFGNYTFGDRLQSSMTAHPKVDPKTGEMFFFGYSFSPP